MAKRPDFLVTCVLLLFAAGAAAQVVPDKLVESNSPLVDIAVIADGGTDVNQTWGRPRVLQSYDGTQVLLYAQGLPDLTAAALRDQIWLFRNENDPTGWSTEYDLFPKVRILPSPSGIGSDTTKNYAHQWPYKAHGRYYMIAQEAANPPNSATFKFYLLGKSADGVNWTWRRFMRVREGMSLDQIAWKDIVIGGTTYNYGFMSGTRENGLGIGAIRFKQDLTTNEWGYDTSSTSTALAVWTDSTSPASWVTVPTCASVGDTSGYDFCMYKAPLCGVAGGSCAADKKIDPQFFLGGRHPSLHRLARHNNKYELWNHSTTPDLGCGCEDSSDPNLENNNTFTYRQFTPPASLTQDPATTLGAGQEVGQDAPAIRCMPASQRQSRITPFRLEWTLDMLYSRTADNKQNPFQCSTTGWAYIVRTRLEKEGTP